MKEEELPLDEREIENAHRVAYLIASYIKKTLTRAEHRELDVWVAASEKNVELFEELTDVANQEKALEWYENLDTEQRLQRLKSRIRKRHASRRLRSIAVAASVLLLLGLASYFYFMARKAKDAPMATTAQPTILATAEKVRLTLDDGRVIGLDSTADGKLTLTHHTSIVKNGNVIAYGATSATAAVYHTLSTAAGGQYQVQLPDGSRVWLNAQSSLRFPTAFTDKERRVELKGEGYFEVTKDASHPFKVQTGDVITEVLGTHFNVNAYEDEGAIRTTLLEGAVRISNGAKSRMLLPGQQARVKEEKIEILTADIEAVIGWKGGRFVFHKTPLSAVLKDIERWYNTPIENKEGVNKHLTATISRSLPLDKVLHLLEGTGDVQFKTKGKKVIVVP